MEPRIPDRILVSTPDGLITTEPNSDEESQPGAQSTEQVACWMEEQAALVSAATSTSSIRPPYSSIQQSAPTFDEKRESFHLLDSNMGLAVTNRRKSTFVSLDSHTPMMSRKRSMRSCMSELEALAAQRRRQVPTIPKHTRSARIDLMAANIQNEFGICGWILTGLSFILIFFTLPISLCMCIKVVQEYERAVIFRLGRLMPGGAKGPGIFFIVPCIDTYRKVDLRVLSFEVPPQEILSKDSVTVAVDAVVYFRISNATISVTNVEDASRSTKLLAQTTLRNILGTKTLAEMLSDREAISLQIQATLDDATEPWGVKVERVEVKDIRLPVQLQRAMAAEAEAAREARAKVIVAEGEQKASKALKEAAEVIAESPSALQLRYLQTLNSISAEKNSTIIFPLPIDLLSSFLHRPVPKAPETPPSARRIRSCCVYKYPEWVQNMASSSSVREQKSMKDSSYQQSTSGADESHPSSANCRIPRNDPKSTLLKTALANRIQPRIPDSANCLSDRNKVRDKNRFIPQREDRLPPPSSSSYQTPRVPRTTSENAIPMSSILERRESSQSDSSRGSNVPKSVTFNDKVEINEIERKDHYNGFDSSNPNFQLIKDTLFKNGWKIQMENNNEILNPMQNLLQPIREDLRSSPSLNLDLVYDETRERPDWMSDEEWIMLQSMYVPSRETSKDPSPPVAFRNPDSDDYPQNSVDDAEVAPSPPPLPDPSAFISVASDSSNVLYPSQQIPSLSSNPRNTNLPSPSNPRSNATTLSRQSSLDKREVQAKPPANQTLNLDVNEGSSTKFKPESGTPISPSKQVLNNGSSQNQTESTTSRPVPPTRRSLSPLKPQPAYPNSSFIKPPSPSKILPSAPQLSPAASQISPLSSKISSPTRDLCNTISSSERPVLYSSPERPAFLPSDRPTTPSATDRPSPSKTFASRAFSPANKSYNTSRSSPSSPVKETNHGPFSRLLPGSLDRLDDELLNTQRMFLNDYSNPSLNSSNTNGHSYLRDSNDYHLQGPSSSFEYNNGQSRYLSVGSSNPSIDHSYQSINRNTYASNTYASINPSGSVFAQNVPSLPSSPTPLRRQNSAFSKGASQNTLTSRGQSSQGLSLSKVPSSSAQNLAKANLSKPALAEDSLASLKNILNLPTGQPTLTSPNTSQLRRPSNLPSGPKSNVSLGQNVPLGSSVPPNASLSSGLKSNLPPGPGSPRKLVKGDVKRLKSPMDLATSFYDNVDAEQQIYLQQQFVNKFGRRKAPIASPEEANRLARKNSMDSNLSTDSRESVVSATSMKTEARIRRFFNY